jgi:hypothetical protein
MGPDTRCCGPLPRPLNATDRNDPEVPLHASYRVHPEPDVSLLERARRSAAALRRREAELYEASLRDGCIRTRAPDEGAA